LVAASVTTTEIYGLARINGNRLNVVTYGSTTTDAASSITLTHNLGRYVVCNTRASGCLPRQIGMTTSASTFDYIDTTGWPWAAAGAGVTVYYSYI